MLCVKARYGPHSMRIAFYLGSSFEKWSPRTIERDGSGASEWMAVEIARHLASRGHEVSVYSDTGEPPTVHDGVRYVDHTEFLQGPISDVLVAYRTPAAIDLSTLGRTERIVFITTDKHHEGSLDDGRVAMTSVFVVVSEWHRARFLSVHKNVPDRKLFVIPNGVNLRNAASSDEFWGRPLIHTSSPDRGLEHAIRAMAEIRRRRPDAVLHVYADFTLPLALARQQQNDWRIGHLQTIEHDVKNTEGVVFHGRVGRQALHQALAASHLWVYPSTVEETSCVCAMEALALGCRVVTTKLGALPETCARLPPECSRLIEPLGAAGLDEYVDAVVRELATERKIPATNPFPLEVALASYEAVITGRGLASSAEAAVREDVARFFGRTENAVAPPEAQAPAAIPVEAEQTLALLGAHSEIAEALEQEFITNPDDPVTSFLLANAYRDALLPGKAFMMYLRRIAMGGDEAEVAAAQVEVEKLAEVLGPRAAKEAAFRAGVLFRASGVSFGNNAQQRQPSAAEAINRAEGDVDVLEVGGATGWRLVMPKVHVGGSLEDIRQPLAEGLSKVSGKRGVPASGELWFGVHATPLTPPAHAIIYQTEVHSSGWFSEEYRRKLAQAAEVWDYSTLNQPHYEARVKRHVPLGFAECLVQEPTIPGSMAYGLVGSRCARRELGPDFRIFDNVHGKERAGIERSIRVHVVPHYYEGAPVGQARIGRYLASGYAVVAEESADQDDYPGPVYVPHGDLIKVAKQLVENELWQAHGALGREIHGTRTMADSLAKAYGKEMLKAWREKESVFLKLNLGACDEQSRVDGFVNVDIHEGADVQADLRERWPWDDGTVDVILAADIIEHLPDKIFTMNEAFRVLKPGGLFKISVPTTDGRSAFQDPTHVSYWNRNSFWYFTDGDAHRERFGERYGVTARFRVIGERETGNAEGVKHLHIDLQAVKGAEATGAIGAASRERGTDCVGPGPIGAQAKPEPRFVGMLRVKNESRWIREVVSSLKVVCDQVYVLDDHSTDDTAMIATACGAVVIPSPFSGLDEARDKNFVLDVIRSAESSAFRPDTNLWIIGIDGDEVLEPGAARLLREYTDPSEVAYSFQVLYVWDHPSQVRVDGVYANFRRFSMFRAVEPGLRFEGTHIRGNLHCKSIPEALIQRGKPHPVRLLHYGYLHHADRIAKLIRYNELDPNNEAEDRYLHMVQGDGVLPTVATGLGLPHMVAATDKRKWAGPLELVPLEGVLKRRGGAP